MVPQGIFWSGSGQRPLVSIRNPKAPRQDPSRGTTLHPSPELGPLSPSDPCQGGPRPRILTTPSVESPTPSSSLARSGERPWVAARTTGLSVALQARGTGRGPLNAGPTLRRPRPRGRGDRSRARFKRRGAGRPRKRGRRGVHGGQERKDDVSGVVPEGLGLEGAPRPGMDAGLADGRGVVVADQRADPARAVVAVAAEPPARRPRARVEGPVGPVVVPPDEASQAAPEPPVERPVQALVGHSRPCRVATPDPPRPSLPVRGGDLVVTPVGRSTTPETRHFLGPLRCPTEGSSPLPKRPSKTTSRLSKCVRLGSPVPADLLKSHWGAGVGSRVTKTTFEIRVPFHGPTTVVPVPKDHFLD